MNPNDYLLHQKFSKQLLAKTNEDVDFIDNHWMSNETHFHLNGYLISRISISGLEKLLFNYTTIHYTTPKLPCGVHVMSCHGVIGSYFFEDGEGSAVTMMSEHYVNMLETFLAPQFYVPLAIDIQNTWFQQDGTLSHSTQQSMAQ